MNDTPNAEVAPFDVDAEAPVAPIHTDGDSETPHEETPTIFITEDTADHVTL